jgi:hypothetical protein
MLRSPFTYRVLAISLLWLALGSSAVARADTPLANQSVQRGQSAEALKEIVRLKKPDSQGRLGTALPQTGLLVALIRSGLTTLNIFESASRRLVQISTSKETGPLNFSRAPHHLAYLVRESPNPARNTIEIFDWRDGKNLVIEPGSGYALLGFALDPEGKRLGYAAMNLRTSRSTNVMWRVGLADLERGETRVTLSSDVHKAPEEGIPVPFAWSAKTGLVYLQGWLPFRGMVKQSVWSMNPEGAKLTQLIAASDFIGVPRLSADGLRLSYLSAELDRLPADYSPAPGAPPGNVLAVMDVASGAKAPWARAGDGAFGTFDWSASGEEVLALAQAWLNGRFRDVEVRRITKSTSLSLAKIHQSESLKAITDIVECRDRALFWVEQERTSARLYTKREQDTQGVFDFPGGAIQLLGCVNR